MDLLTNPVVLVLPKPTAYKTAYTDGCDEQVGGVMLQTQPSRTAISFQYSPIASNDRER